MIATFSSAPIVSSYSPLSVRVNLGAYSRSPAASRGPIRGLGLRVVLAAELRRLGPAFVPGFLNDRRDLGVGEELLKALPIPVEEHPDPVVLIGVAKDSRTLGPVLRSLLRALGWI